MARKIALTFLRGWSRYNAGEIAGFDADQAEALIDQGIAEKAPDQPEAGDRVIASILIDPRDTDAFKEASAEIERAAQDLIDREADLAAREADLEARALDLDRREAALKVDPVAAPTEPAEVVDADGVVTEAKAEPAATGKAVLPKQGR
ncbi:hypothetical protein [Paracoccus aestuariivivens]|uniref:Uncharacterized protein n=1 Tax=Paracoccus aestuariivivens TaxID=1820333 RepID=A0A6L6J6I0_9RHOB|nr:hypothetical protein [Paracoccus aestuariivivens]MTH76319.1 hypothetical protein [Paracoccus aestuariivivens]